MIPATYFLLPDGRLRAGWRMLIFLLACIAANAAWLWLFASVRSPNPLAGSFGNLTVTLLVTWGALRTLDHRPLAAAGLAVNAGSALQLSCGVLAGLGSVVLTASSLIAVAGVRITAGGPVESFAFAAILSTTLLIVLAASFEELLFRGYLFQRMVEGLGAAGAVAISALIFGYTHRMNPSASLLSTANTALAGVVLSLGYLRSRSLWYPIGWHVSWNWSLAMAGFPVSGLNLFNLPWSAAGPQETSWLHGGDYGPEGGAACTVILIAVCLGLWLCPAQLGCRRPTVEGPMGQAQPESPASIARHDHDLGD